MSERWRKIPGWPYEASSLGSIRRAGDSVALIATPDKDDYLRVTLADRGRRKTFGVHTLVMLAFKGPPEVLHGGGGKQDNTPQNLRYGSRRDNERDKRRDLTVRSGTGGTNEKEEKTGEGSGRSGSPPLTPVSPVAGGLG